MHKQSIKNFICSFLFSLLAVICVNKVFMHVPETENRKTEKNTKIQNISLFSAPADSLALKTEGLAVDISEIEKLTATVPPLENITDHQSTAVFAAGALPPPPPDTSDDIIIGANLPDLMPASSIKEPDVQKIIPAISETKKETINTDLAAAKEIILEKENIITKAEPVNDYEKSGIVYADISDTFDTNNNENNPEPENLPEAVYTPEGADNTEQPQKLLVAANDLPNTTNISEQSLLEDEESDIPLLEGNDTLHAHINIAQNTGSAQIAMLEPNNLVSTIEEIEEPEEKTLAEADLKQDEWTQMSEKEENDSPWVVAKGNKFAKNQAVVERFSKENPSVSKEASPTGENTPDITDEESKKVSDALKPETNAKDGTETKVAYQMIQNLLIPIPEDIMNDTNLTPQLTASPKEKPDDTEKKAEKNAAQKTGVNNKKLNENEKQSGLFKSIASWFSDDKESTTNKEQKVQKKTSGKKSGIDFFGFVSGEDENKTDTQILPAELRLSFQPNRAEISGQTLRWIHAFADTARDNNDMYIEIRIDGTSSFALQKKRLNLLSTILANRGVDFRKINIVFTSREPNSFIIRNIRFNNNEEVVVNKNSSNNSYYRPW